MAVLFFELNKLSESRTTALVGGKSKFLIKGSAGLFIKTIKAEGLPTDLVGAKANFEIRESGILIYISKSNKRFVFPISFIDLNNIGLKGGEEYMELMRFSPMRFLMTIGTPTRYARYFRLKLDRYDVEPIKVTLNSKHLNMLLECNGYNNYSLKRFFEQVGLLIEEP